MIIVCLLGKISAAILVFASGNSRKKNSFMIFQIITKKKTEESAYVLNITCFYDRKIEVSVSVVPIFSIMPKS
jgi:hypothetical protein